SVTWEKRIIETAGRSGFAALASANTLEELRHKHEAFKKASTVSEVDSALLLIPRDQEEKLKILGDIAPVVGNVRVARPLPLDMDRLITAWETLKRRLDIAKREAPAGDAQRELERASGDVGRLITKLRQSDRAMTDAALTLLQRNLNPKMIGLEQLPPEIKRKFVSEKGRFLIQIHPAVNIWEREGAFRF